MIVKMGLNKSWSRTKLRTELSKLGFYFNVNRELKLTEVFTDYNKTNRIITINNQRIILDKLVKIEIPIYMIDTIKIKRSDESLIVRLFMMNNQYLEFEIDIEK